MNARRTVARAVLVMVAMSSLVGGAAPSVSASVDAPVRSGDAVVVDAANRSPIDHGGSATEFSLELPAGASCPGDSLHDQWRVQSFIVPAGVEPGTLRYELIAPAGGGVRYALYDLRGNPYTQQLTQPNSSAGQPGTIARVVPLSFAVFPPGTIPGGTYRIGLACTYFRETARYWDTTVVVVDDAADEPAAFVWRLEAASPTVLADESPGHWWPYAVAAAALTALVALVLRRRARSRAGDPSTGRGATSDQPPFDPDTAPEEARR